MKEQLKKAKAIIEGYDGPAVRVIYPVLLMQNILRKSSKHLFHVLE